MVLNNTICFALKNFIFLVFLLLLTPLLSANSTDTAQASIYCPDDVYQDYLSFLGDRDVMEITDYTGKHSRRDVIEVVLMLQALGLGSYNKPLQFLAENVPYTRKINMVARGELLGYCTTAFAKDIKKYQNELASSETMIHANEFIAGLFVRPDRINDIKIKKKGDIKDYLAVCNKNWPLDMQVLEDLNAQCVYASSWDQVVNLLHAGRADFMLAPFQSSNNGDLLVDEKIFTPIPGIKVQLGNSRHYIVSKNHPGYKAFNHALNTGIKKLRENKTIKKAYTESGFFNESVTDWTLLNAE